MDVLVFGGSFDPPHRGHLRLLRAAIALVKPELAYLVPAYRSPLKEEALAGPAERLALTRLALRESLSPRERRAVRLEAFELNRGRTTYTYETLRMLRNRHPNARFYFVAGSDAFADFERWKNAAELRQACRWLVARRPGARLPGGRGFPDFKLVAGEFPDLSSSDIRSRFLAEVGASACLERGVLARIRQERLYGFAIRDRLQSALSAERYRHSVCVAKRALEFSKIHGMDCEKSALAGLLHDCGRALSAARMAAFAKRRRLRVPRLKETARREPLLLHAYVGEVLARERFGVRDGEVLSAIRKHTLGAESMSPLDLLIYAADACSSDRRFPEAASIRRAARADLGEGFRKALGMKLSYARKRGSWIHPLGPRLWGASGA